MIDRPTITDTNTPTRFFRGCVNVPTHRHAFRICVPTNQAIWSPMDEQQSLPPLEDYYTQMSRDALRTDESLGGVATAAEGFVSVVAPVREQQEDASVTEPVEEHRRPNVPTKVC